MVFHLAALSLASWSFMRAPQFWRESAKMLHASGFSDCMAVARRSARRERTARASGSVLPDSSVRMAAISRRFSRVMDCSVSVLCMNPENDAHAVRARWWDSTALSLS